MANNLERAYHKHFVKEFPEEVIVSDEDYDVDEDDSFSSRKRGKSRLNEKSSAKKSKMGCMLILVIFVFFEVFMDSTVIVHKYMHRTRTTQLIKVCYFVFLNKHYTERGRKKNSCLSSS